MVSLEEFTQSLTHFSQLGPLKSLWMLSAFLNDLHRNKLRTLLNIYAGIILVYGCTSKTGDDRNLAVDLNSDPCFNSSMWKNSFNTWKTNHFITTDHNLTFLRAWWMVAFSMESFQSLWCSFKASNGTHEYDPLLKILKNNRLLVSVLEVLDLFCHAWSFQESVFDEK